MSSCILLKHFRQLLKCMRMRVCGRVVLDGVRSPTRWYHTAPGGAGLDTDNALHVQRRQSREVEVHCLRSF